MASKAIEQVLTRGVSSRPLFDPMDQIAGLQATVKVQEVDLIVRDDLSSMTEFRCTAQGYVRTTV